MTIDEAIRHAEEVAEEQEKLYGLCLPEYNCDGKSHCNALKNGKDRGCLKCGEEHRQLAEWLKDYKRLKEQEPSEDAISREAVLDTISELNAISFYEAQEDSKETYYEIRQAIKDLSPVKQEPKTVIYSGDGYADGEMVYDMAECPNCGYEYENGDKDWGLPFCPSCGQKLNWERNEE